VDVDHRVALQLAAQEAAPDADELRLQRRARELLDALRLRVGQDEGVDLDPLGVRERELDRLVLAVEDLGSRASGRGERERRRQEPPGARTCSRSPC
jgi:hypothetical protein